MDEDEEARLAKAADIQARWDITAKPDVVARARAVCVVDERHVAGVVLH